MYQLAKALAIEAGLRYMDPQSGYVGSKPTSDKCIVGYGLTMAELKHLYAEHGFSVNGKGLESHIRTWEYNHLVIMMTNGAWVFFTNCGQTGVFDALRQIMPDIQVIA